MRAGRARWRIESGTINVLESHGYEFGYNFGNGNCNLLDVLAQLMMLAFHIDQLEQRFCALFDAAGKKADRLKYFRETIRIYFLTFRIRDWETLYLFVAYPRLAPELTSNDPS